MKTLSDEKILFELGLTEFAQREDVSVADKKGAVEQYGNVKFADSENKKYPIDTEEHIRAAWNYINKSKNAGKYSATQVGRIKRNIVSAWKKKIDKDGPPSAKEMSMKTKDFVIFSTGKHNGEEYTTADLDQMAANFNGDDPPHIILGHSSDYKGQSLIPSFGRILGGLKRVGNDLVACGVEMSEKMAEWIKEKFITGRSIELAKGNVVKAVGMLGAASPAVKGMPGMDSMLTGIVANYSLPVELKTVEFQDAPAVDFESLENSAIENTVKNIDQLFATCVSDIENHLNSDDDDEEVKQLCMNAMMECYQGVAEEINEHFNFITKLDELEEGEGSEMMKKLTKWFRVPFTFKPKHKEIDMNEKEFNEKKAVLEADQAKLETEKKEFAAQQEAIRLAAIDARIKEFIDAEVKNGCSAKLFESMKSSEAIKAIVLASAKEFQDGTKPIADIEGVKEYMKIVPKPTPGAVLTQEEKKKNDIIPATVGRIAKADGYVAKHPTEFKDLTPIQARSKALQLEVDGEIKFE